MADLNRREFVAGAFACVGCALTVRGVLAQPAPPASPAAPAAPPTSPPAATEPFDAGEVSKIAKGFTETFSKSKGVILVRDDKNYIYAVSGVCTHQGGSLKVQGDALQCPKHKATFDKQGKATKGPAKGQLSRYGVSVKDGHLWVDASIIFLPGDFAKEGSWVQG